MRRAECKSWHWREDISDTLGGDLTFASMFGPTSRRIGALGAMRLIAEPINPINGLHPVWMTPA
jgi:hypothetical protein